MWFAIRSLRIASLALLVACVALAYGRSLAQSTSTSADKGVPPVAMSEQHQAMCKVLVGDEFPAATLQPEFDGKSVDLKGLYGKKATIVGVFDSSGRMTNTMLRDLEYDVLQKYSDNSVSVVAVATNIDSEKATEALKKSKFSKSIYADTEQKLMKSLGSGRMPRIYVLDATGKIVWMDIEFSQATRRELKATLQAIAPKPKAS